MSIFLRLSLLLFCFLLPGCGTYYAVSVDSMNNGNPSGPNCLLVSDTEGVGEKDATFLELARLAEPAFHARGWNLILNRDAAQMLVKMSWWQEEPRTVTETSYVTHLYPVEVGWGRHRRIEYVYYDEPVINTYVVYAVNLLFEAKELDKGKETGRQLWQTALRSSGVSDDYRARLFSMAKVLPQVLGSASDGPQRYEVFLGSDGEITVEHSGPGRLW